MSFSDDSDFGKTVYRIEKLPFGLSKAKRFGTHCECFVEPLNFGTKFHGLLLYLNSARTLHVRTFSAADLSYIKNGGLAVIDCSWNQIKKQILLLLLEAFRDILYEGVASS
uniref:Uncharacterized protein n=1 Tax=Setaria digitata TaxID=48799 RepID=A0A915Q4W4_9BILA